MKIQSIIIAGTLSVAAFVLASQAANAMPAAQVDGVVSAPIEKTYGGCGVNGHRGPYGGCRFGGQRQVYNARRAYYGGYRRW